MDRSLVQASQRQSHTEVVCWAAPERAKTVAQRIGAGAIRRKTLVAERGFLDVRGMARGST